jgi:glycerate kinase
MAEASGLTLVPEGKKNPLKTTTYGTGELILEAVNRNCSKIVIGIGGSATNDGGAGMAQALVYRILDEEGCEVGFGGGELSKASKIKVSGLFEKLKDIEFIASCDVNNPLCGDKGASAVFGPQKGATLDMVKVLDKNLLHFAGVLKKDIGKDIKDIPGAGAAGGLGAGLMAFLGAKLLPGIEMVLNTVDFDDKVRNADLVITGEGRVDFQSAFGKVPMGVAKASKKHGVPVIAVAGSIGEGAEALYDVGVDAIASIMTHPMDLDTAMKNSFELLKSAVERVMRVYAINNK